MVGCCTDTSPGPGKSRAICFSPSPPNHVSGGERQFGVKDDLRIVADEYLTFPLRMIGLLATAGALLLAFLTHRLCDILKPPPARSLQRLPGGWGIVLDDVIASVYALALNYGLYRLLFSASAP